MPTPRERSLSKLRGGSGIGHLMPVSSSASVRWV